MTLARDINVAIAEDARLFVLRELTQQVDGRLNLLLIERVLDASGIRRSRDWIDTQLNKLAELGAVRLDRAGGLTIAEITRTGRDHVAARGLIAGVTPPSEVD